MGVLAHDAVVAWRGLMRRPFYAVATAVMLALAVGANAVAFGMFYDVEMAPLPYRDAGRLVMLRDRRPLVGLTMPMATPRDYQRVLASVKGIEAAGVWTFGGEVPVMIGGRRRAVDFGKVTPSWYRTLGVAPALGRLPSRASGRPGGAGAAMISYKFWQSAYGGEASVIGRVIRVGGRSERIVGVLPRRYQFLAHNDVLVPLVLPATPLVMRNLNDFVVARLQPGVSLATMNRRIGVLKNVILRSGPKETTALLNSEYLDVQALRPAVISLSSLGVLPFVLQGMALLLLALAVANAGNLAMVRQRGRDGEFRLRRVLGASRWAVMRLLVLEQVPIGVVTAVLAGLFAWLAQAGIASLGTAIDVAPFRLGFGLASVACVVVLSAVSVGLVAALPLAQSSRRRLNGAIGQSAKAAIGRRVRLAQRGLGAVQIVLALTLLVGSAVLGGSLYAAMHRKLGFEAAHRLIASVLLPKPADHAAGIETMVDRLRAVPGFRMVGGLGYDAFPFSQSRDFTTVSRSGAGAPHFHGNLASPDVGYFRALGLTMRYGRRPTRLEYRSGAKVIVVGAGLARRLYGTARVVGRMLDLDGLGHFRIIGVTQPVVWRVMPWVSTPGTMYAAIAAVPLTGAPLGGVDLVIDYRGSVGAARARAKSVIEAAVPGAVVTRIRSYRRLIFIETAFRQLASWIAGAFSGIALVLAGLGVYAVNAFIARARLPEFGLRAMLGANSARLLLVALADAAWLLGVGLVGGSIGGYLLIRVMSPLLFDVGAIAPWVFFVSIVGIAGIVLGAAWRPAARAARMPVKRLLDSA